MEPPPTASAAASSRAGLSAVDTAAAPAAVQAGANAFDCFSRPHPFTPLVAPLLAIQAPVACLIPLLSAARRSRHDIVSVIAEHPGDRCPPTGPSPTRIHGLRPGDRGPPAASATAWLATATRTTAAGSRPTIAPVTSRKTPGYGPTVTRDRDVRHACRGATRGPHTRAHARAYANARAYSHTHRVAQSRFTTGRYPA